jgi:hypothetical protein
MYKAAYKFIPLAVMTIRYSVHAYEKSMQRHFTYFFIYDLTLTVLPWMQNWLLFGRPLLLTEYKAMVKVI